MAPAIWLIARVGRLLVVAAPCGSRSAIEREPVAALLHGDQERALGGPISSGRRAALGLLVLLVGLDPVAVDLRLQVGADSLPGLRISSKNGLPTCLSELAHDRRRPRGCSP